MMRTILLAAALAVACVGEAGPGGRRGPPTGPPEEAPIPVPDPGQPAAAAVLEAEGDSLVVSDRVVTLAPGITSTVSIQLIAAAPDTFDVVVAQADTSAAVLRAEPLYYHRGGLQLADFVGRVLSDAEIIVVSPFHFSSPGPSAHWALPIEGKAPGKALIHGFWFAETGEELGRFQIEARVR